MNLSKWLATAFSLVAATGATFAQHSIQGTITTPDSKPVPFAVVGVQNTFINAQADAEGHFKLQNLKAGTYILLTKCVGYKTHVDTVKLQQDLNLAVALSASDLSLDEIMVSATRADKESGMAYSTVGKEELQKQNLGQDAPMVLGNLTSAVSNSDAGNGVGYTGIRIRGTDGTRINVTINGIPVNDAESQGTFFVNMADLLSSTNSIQVQRGAGTSSNGAGAFGASINMQTNTLNDKAYGEIATSGGSFGTLRNSLSAGTGLLNNHFTFDARASRIVSNGYVDRASSKLYSYYLSGGYYDTKNVVKFILFSGTEKTYQAWDYIPQDTLLAGNRTYNPTGAYYDAAGRLQYYPNETDNYKQDNYQLHLIHTFSDKLTMSVAGHYTAGKGYYEQYKNAQTLADYKMQDVIVGSDTITKTDLIRRRWLDNDFLGLVYSLNYTPYRKLKFTLGGGNNQYFGRHNGDVIWARYFSTAETGNRYYDDKAYKNDNNVYLKTTFKPVDKLDVFVDLQYRNVFYSFLGFDQSLVNAQQSVVYDFFNPKLGLNYRINDQARVYASYAITHKEPNRDDFTQSSSSSRPEAETLMDLELGASYAVKNAFVGLNFYNMSYDNQLVLNGQINDVGAYNRVNVKTSYRRGLELEAGLNLGKYIGLNGNVTFSQNRLKNYTEYLDSSNADYSVYTQHKVTYAESNISFSPNVVSAVTVSLKPLKNLEIALINKYVGRQYMDNTSRKERSINPYNVNHVRINYSIYTKLIKQIDLSFTIYNILDRKYETNGYTYSYYLDDKLYTQNALSPAAPVNFLAGLHLKF